MILLMTAVHGRREILKQVIDHHSHLPWLKFAVCSTDEEVEYMFRKMECDVSTTIYDVSLDIRY